jgi:predicted dehydrogenase
MTARNPKIRWGILGTGHIAHKFAAGLSYLPDAELVAVGSRTAAAAEAFGSQHNVPHRHASYEELAGDPDVEVIYVATPHHLHAENSLLCMQHGKAVLCEKPFTLNAAQAKTLVDAARQKKLFLMEGMWSRCLPSWVKLRQLVAEGAVGEVRMVKADLCFRAEFNPRHRLFDPELAGGALLDVGCYVVSFAGMLLGTPLQAAALAHLGQTGVDEQTGILLGYAGGALAVLSTAVRTSTPQDAFVFGTTGWIRVHAPFATSQRLTVQHAGGSEEVIECPFQGNGFNYEAAEVMACLRGGLLESAVMPLDESIEIMRTLDWLRLQIGLRYPME